MQTGQDVQQK